MNHPLLSVLMVSFNTRKLTLKAIASLLEGTASPIEVIVIDNASDDGSADAIEGEFPQVKLIRSDENLGFAKANNTAARYSRGELLLLLNPDTEVLAGAIDELLSFARRNRSAGIWGGRTLYPDGSVNASSCWRAQTLWSLFLQAIGIASLFRQSEWMNPERVLVREEMAPIRVDIVSGCLLMIERSLFQSLQGFSEDFFMYGEDADLCLRSKSFGAMPLIDPNCTIVHHGGASDRVQEHKITRLLEAKSRLIRRHLPVNRQPLGLMLLAAWPFSRVATHWILGALGIRESRERARVWRAVWSRRDDWLRQAS